MPKKDCQFRRVQTYDRLERHYSAWMDPQDSLEFLCVLGRPGLGKTYAYESGEVDVHLFRGRSSAMAIYLEILRAPAKPIIFDDVRELLRDSNCLDLMKQLCDSRHKRVIRWRTETPLLKEEERSAVCSSKVLVVLNTAQKSDPDVAAIIDRFDAIEFDPSKEEVIERMRLFCKDQDDVDMLSALPIDPTLRDLKRYETWKASEHLDEIEEILSVCAIPQRIQWMMDILQNVPRGRWITEFQGRFDGTAENALMFWKRHRRQAERLIMPAKIVHRPTDPCTKGTKAKSASLKRSERSSGLAGGGRNNGDLVAASV